MLGLIGVLGAACVSCALEDVVTAQQRLLMPEVLVSQQATDECTRFALKVVNGTATVEPLYNSTGCKSDSLRLETDSVPVYDPATGKLRVPLVIRNLGGTAVVAPARVCFLADSAQFLDSLGNVVPGTPNIVATNYDLRRRHLLVRSANSAKRLSSLLLARCQYQRTPGPDRRSGRDRGGRRSHISFRRRLPHSVFVCRFDRPTHYDSQSTSRIGLSRRSEPDTA